LRNDAFFPTCGAPADPVAQAPPKPVSRKGFGWRAGKWVIIAVMVFVVLIVPIIPRGTIVYVDGTTQTVTNRIQYSTSLQVYATTTASPISVYTGSYKYFHDWWGGNYQYFYNWWGANYCYVSSNQLICNYNAWPWYAASYGTTVTVTPAQQVVSVRRTQQYSGLETLTLTYLNGKSTIVRNVYSDNLSQSGTSTVQSNVVVTATVTSTITTPVTRTVPCHQCLPEHVTEHVSILQLLFGY